MGKASRQSDEIILAALAMRRQGCSSFEIEAATGASASYLRGMMSRVRRADLLESGENPDTVVRGY